MDFEDIIYNLSESTIYLIGDPELISLWEAHQRWRNALKAISGTNKNYEMVDQKTIKKKNGKIKKVGGFKDLGEFDNARDAIKSIFGSGSYRQNVNSVKDVNASRKKLIDPTGKTKEQAEADKKSAQDLGRFGFGKDQNISGVDLKKNERLNKLFKRKEDLSNKVKNHNLNNASFKKFKTKSPIIGYGKTTLKNFKDHLKQDPLKQIGSNGPQTYAASAMRQNAFYRNSPVFNYADEKTKKKFIEHEKQHLRDPQWLKKHLGKIKGEKAVRDLKTDQIVANSRINQYEYLKDPKKDYMKDYHRSPFEKTAHLVGAHTHDENDNTAHSRHQNQIHNILLNGVKGKRVPISTSQKMRQTGFYPDTADGIKEAYKKGYSFAKINKQKRDGKWL